MPDGGLSGERQLLSFSAMPTYDSALLRSHMTKYFSSSGFLSVRGGEQALLRKAPMAVEVDRTSKPYSDFQKWCREIVWWGNKKGAYLYAPRAAEITPELAGHY